jgi:hypothetical protein
MNRFVKALLLFILSALCLLGSQSVTRSDACELPDEQGVMDAYHVWYKPPTRPGGPYQYTVAKQNPIGYFHLYGPATFAQCGAKMKELGVPGWEKF